MIHSLSSTAQFITTTFRPEMLVNSDQFYGVLFNNQKISSIRSIKREEAMEFVDQVCSFWFSSIYVADVIRRAGGASAVNMYGFCVLFLCSVFVELVLETLFFRSLFAHVFCIIRIDRVFLIEAFAIMIILNEWFDNIICLPHQTENAISVIRLQSSQVWVMNQNSKVPESQIWIQQQRRKSERRSKACSDLESVNVADQLYRHQIFTLEPLQDRFLTTD